VLSAPITPPIELVPRAARLRGDAAAGAGPPWSWDGIAIASTAGAAALVEGSVPLDGGGPAGDESVTGGDVSGGDVIGGVVTGGDMTGGVVTGGGGVAEVGGAALSSWIATAGAGPVSSGGALSF
jgi:hypothetical protein